MLDTNLSNESATSYTWRLKALELLRPEDELEGLLASGDFGAASALASKHQLSQDSVSKCAADSVSCTETQRHCS